MLSGGDEVAGGDATEFEGVVIMAARERTGRTTRQPVVLAPHRAVD